MKNKDIFYDIYSEFYNVNKFRELKNVVHHGTNRLEHITRVAKLSFIISRKLNLDYISCTRGAILHDFFTSEDANRSDGKYRDFLKKHPLQAINNSQEFFKLNEVESDIILSHMYPITKDKPKYAESKVVCITDKLVSYYEFFRYQLNFSANFAFIFLLKFIRF